MTRVLHLITRYLYGGAEKTTRNAIEALNEADREYDVRLGTGAEYDPERLQSLGIETTVFQTICHYNPVTAIIAVFSVAWYLRREDIDILHTHSTEAGIIGRLAGYLANTPVVIHEIHGDPITIDRNPLLNRVIVALERRTAPLADCLIIKSERIRETFLDRGIGRASQYELIYHGVDTDRFPQMDPNTRGSSVRILFVGRLASGKGLYDLLNAVEQLEGIQVDIVGDGELREDIAEQVEQRGLDTVSMLGYRDDIPSFMARSDMLVLPSYREGTPRVITEAMAAGLPVVATNIAGIPEQVSDGETGFLYTPGDVDALTKSIRRLVKDAALRAEFGRKARKRVDRFEVETAKAAYQNLYARQVQR